MADTSEVLRGKGAIITGVSSGIGLATASAFLEAGALVLGVDRSPAPTSITAGEMFKFHQVDLTEPTAPCSIVAAFRSAFPNHANIDVLVNNAGIMDYNHGVDSFSDETWERLIAVNLTAPVKLMREVVKIMKQNGGGSIVNVASKAAMSGATAGVAYTASKHGLVGATKNTAWLYKEEGIRCNAIAPGAIKTNLIKPSDREKMGPDSSAKLAPVIGVHLNPKLPHTTDGVGKPEDAARIIMFLASDLSIGISGAVVPVDNGWSTI